MNTSTRIAKALALPAAACVPLPTMNKPTIPSQFSDFDLHLFGQGTHDQIYNIMGAHSVTVDGKAGVNFSVWAPAAERVAVVGEFNSWNESAHQMSPVGESGIWELFVPDVGHGQLYKYAVQTGGFTVLKTDPYGFFSEVPPNNASVVWSLDKHQWQDGPWIKQREERDPLVQPMSVYEVHLGSWQTSSDKENGWLNYRTLAQRLVEYCQKMGFTHLELMPISEHPYTGSWGYQTVGYFAVTSRYGTPDDFMYFVDHCHQNGIGVIIDWVPAHFPRDGHGLARFDGTPIYEHPDPQRGEHPDWGTYIFDYGRNQVRNFLISNALFWFDKYHIDGLRVDAVASMLYLDYSRDAGCWKPNKYGGRENLEAIELLKQMNERVHDDFPGVMTIAEESTAWSGVTRPPHSDGLGFTLKWNMGWMNDTLQYTRQDPVHRKFHHDELTFSLVYAYSENFLLPFSHDEVVHGKGSLIRQMPGDQWQKFANLRLLYSYMWTHPGKKLLFMSDEFAQWDEWDCDQSIQWELLKWETHQGIQRTVCELNRLLIDEPALHQLDFSADGFQWLNCKDSQMSTISYLRNGEPGTEPLVVICNFTPVAHEQHRIGVPLDGEYCELFNSDAKRFGGTNFVNADPLLAEEEGCDDQPFCLKMRVPPLAAVILKRK